MKELKKHLSLDGQVQLLIDRGLIVNDREYAKGLLSNVNYYRFTGYLFGFRKFGSKDKYVDGITIEKIKKIYDFDRRLTRILLYALEDVEETLKTRLSYAVTEDHPDNPLIYLDESIYRDHDQFEQFSSLFDQAKKHNAGVPFVKHHVNNYGGSMPMWVAVELFTMGNLQKVYANLRGRYQKKIARAYNTGSDQMKSWLDNLTYTRNHLAHFMRVYDYDFGRTPAKCDRHHVYKETSNRIFDQIYTMSFMFSDKTEWNNYIVPELSTLLEEYEDVILLKNIGFPENWDDILRL